MTKKLWRNLNKKMDRIKTLTYFLPIVFFCFLFLPVRGQTPEMGIDLTWSTDTYIPAGYPGKALPVKGSHIRVVAVIDHSILNPHDLVYKWFLDDHIQKADSGQNKQVFEFDMDKNSSRKQSIRVKMESIEGISLGDSSYLYLEPQDPEVVLKADIFSENPDEEYQVTSNQEIKFIAQPYFFNVDNLDELNYVWSLNGQTVSQVDDNEEANVFTLKVGLVEGVVEQDLKVSIENKNNPIERAQKTVQLIFNP